MCEAPARDIQTEPPRPMITASAADLARQRPLWVLDMAGDQLPVRTVGVRCHGPARGAWTLPEGGDQRRCRWCPYEWCSNLGVRARQRIAGAWEATGRTFCANQRRERSEGKGRAMALDQFCSRQKSDRRRRPFLA